MEINIDQIIPKNFERQAECIIIQHYSANYLTYNDFFKNYMSLNIPVVITDVDFLTSTSIKWIKGNDVNIDELNNVVYTHDVPVANCSKEYFNSHEKNTMKFCDYADYWKNRKDDLLYLKDFHLKYEFPSLNFYKLPEYFASDWLNEYLIDKSKEDYRFVYLGVEGTFTNFHADVFTSYSWSANVCGRKRWLILPKDEEEFLKDDHGNLPFKITVEMLKEKFVRYYDIIQEPNEIIFIPSGWYHQVHNLTDCLSINHNWFNGCNVMYVYENLLENLKDVIRTINDCSDMDDYDEHCQLMLKSVFGMNIREFVDILCHIVEKRINSNDLFDNYTVGFNQAYYDVRQAEIVLNKVMSQYFYYQDPTVKSKISETLIKAQNFLN